MKKLAFTLLLIISAIDASAQLDIGKQNEEPVIPSWESYEFMKYGTIGTSLYTGTINYSVPVYTYIDNDFEIPISLEYSTNGYRVNHRSGILGHGWSLNVPGIITRQIKGIPDEEYTTMSHGQYYGCWYNNLGISMDYEILHTENPPFIKVYSAKKIIHIPYAMKLNLIFFLSTSMDSQDNLN